MCMWCIRANAQVVVHRYECIIKDTMVSIVGAPLAGLSIRTNLFFVLNYVFGRKMVELIPTTDRDKCKFCGIDTALQQIKEQMKRTFKRLKSKNMILFAIASEPLALGKKTLLSDRIKCTLLNQKKMKIWA